MTPLASHGSVARSGHEVERYRSAVLLDDVEDLCIVPSCCWRMRGRGLLPQTTMRKVGLGKGTQMKTGSGAVVTGELAEGHARKVILVMGQPRSGKTTVARRISETLGLPVLHTDRLRTELGMHCPWCGFDTEIEPCTEPLFLEHLRKATMESDGIIIEGMSVAPRNVGHLSPDAAVVMTANMPPAALLRRCRQYDSPTCWTSGKADTYLLHLFANYRDYGLRWEREARAAGIDVVDTAADYEGGIDEAVSFLMRQLGK